jgi:hypothetical protein
VPVSNTFDGYFRANECRMGTMSASGTGCSVAPSRIQSVLGHALQVRKRVGGGRRISKQIRELIFRMIAENPTWVRRASTASLSCSASRCRKQPFPAG